MSYLTTILCEYITQPCVTSKGQPDHSMQADAKCKQQVHTLVLMSVCLSVRSISSATRHQI